MRGKLQLKRFARRLICFAAVIGMLCTFACSGQTENTVRDPAEGQEAAATPAPATAAPTIGEDEIIQIRTEAPTELPTIAPTPEPTEEPTPEPTEEPTPEPTAEPVPETVTIGVVGDIMMPSYIVKGAKTGSGYDFDPLFAPFADLFAGVDLMCGNLETPLAGDARGYSGSKDPNTGLISFNAPDSLIDTLKGYGFDLLTTANNHCFDRGIKGLYRTVEVIRAAGLYQTGTYLNAEDREQPCVIEVNGMKLGFVASTRLLNQAYKDCGREEEHIALGYLVDSDGEKLSPELLRDIERVREAGAEFVILFAHWDYENSSPAAPITKRLAKKLLEAGADCIIGSHPHRVKGAEYITVERKDGPYTGLVMYSLGNFTANQDFEMMVGLYAQLTLTRDPETGKVSLTEAAAMPSYVLRRDSGAKYVVVPAYEDPKNIQGLKSSLTGNEIRLIGQAREHAIRKLGTDAGITILGGN